MAYTNRFEAMVDSVFIENPEISFQRTAVEKELLHQDILRILRKTGIITNLVFMGGTCLRLCYESSRLSEDLDFSTETEFSAEDVNRLSSSISYGLSEKYSLDVTVRKPEKDTDTDTWIIRIITHPERSDIPSQQIHLDICHYPSYRRELRRIHNYYPVDFGSGQLFLNVESQEEILADKLLALALRNRIKNRDIWDIEMLNERRIQFEPELLKKKSEDHGVPFDELVMKLKKRMNDINNNGLPDDFKSEMMRFVKVGDYNSNILSTEQAGVAFSTIISDYLRAAK